MGSLLRGKNIKRTIVNDVASLIAYVTNSSGTESITMSPSATKVTLGGQTSSLRVSRGGEMAVGTGVEGAVLAIVTCARAPKAFGESRSGATKDGDIEEACRGRNDRTIVAKLHNKGTVDIHSIFVKAVLGVDGSEGGRSVRWSWRQQSCK